MAIQVEPDTRPKRALIYTRVSEDRAGGRSPAEQENESRAVCEREGWDVAEVVTDSVGASRHSKGTRTGWKRANELISSGAVDVLVTWENSRAQRDLLAYAELRERCATAGVLWSYKGRTHDLTRSGDRFTTGLDALLAEREADETSDRVRRAVRANAVQGRPHGRRLFGYRRVYDQTTGVLLGQELDLEEAEIVRYIFQRNLEGVGLRTIAGELNDQGSRTQTGSLWQDTQVRRVLANPAYAARRVHRGEVIGDADWEAIVDDDTFDRIAARFEQRRMSQTRVVKTARLVTGVGRCGKCGGKIACGHDRGQRKVYYCKSGHHVARDMLKMDEFVSAVVIERLSRPDVDAALDDAGDPTPSESDAARTRITELTARLDDAVDQFSAGELTAATLGRIEQKLRAEIAELEQSVRAELAPIDLDVPDDVESWWDELDPGLRREVVNSLFEAIVILPSTRGSRRFDPDAVRVEWRR